MRLQNPTLCLLAALAAAAPGFALADPAAPPKAPSQDVTITVVPAGQDVMKTVVQIITVPASKKPTRAPKASTAGTAGQAGQHGDMPMTGMEQAAQQAQQQAQQRAQQAQQQAQEQRQAHVPPVQQPPPGQQPPP